MPGILIDRLTLKLSGGEYNAERLARLIAERLAVSELPVARGRLDAIRFHLAAEESTEKLVNRVVERLLREMARSL
jgi:hypothetical protein